MRILICNDDGIYAPGIEALSRALRDLGDICIVAPAAEQSAVGHAITLANPLRTQKIYKNGEFFGTAVSGTPADCVKLAVYAILEGKPDLIVSGINLGPNAGISVIYSGTVSAATEGTILGIPSMAVSLSTFKDPLWDTAAAYARKLAERVLTKGLPDETLLNVNVPNIPLEAVKGMKLTRMGRSRFVETFDRRQDPRGNVYYWMDGYMKSIGETKETDVQAIDDGYVSLTPIWFDLTHQSAMSHFNSTWTAP